MEELNEVGSAIYAIEGNPSYDENVKYLLALKPVLASILKGVAKEYKGMQISDIVSCIEGEPMVATIQVEPGLTNQPMRIQGMNTEDSIPNEGKVTYDIKFKVKNPGAKESEPIAIIVDIEAQLDFHPGYDIVTRGVYYCARSLSSQKTVEFTKSNYQNIKKVYSVWICANPPEYCSNSIISYALQEEVLLGNPQLGKNYYDLLGIVLVMLPKDGYQESKPSLPGMLKTLLNAKESKETIINRLETFYDIPTTETLERRVENMCNLSVGIKQEGRVEGRTEGRAEIINQMLKMGHTKESIATLTGLSLEEIEKILAEGEKLESMNIF